MTVDDPVDPLQTFAHRSLVDLTDANPATTVEVMEALRLMSRRILVLERALRDAGVDLITVIE